MPVHEIEIKNKGNPLRVEF